MRKIALILAALGALTLFAAKSWAGDTDKPQFLSNLVYRTIVNSDASDNVTYREVQWGRGYYGRGWGGYGGGGYYPRYSYYGGYYPSYSYAYPYYGGYSSYYGSYYPYNGYSYPGFSYYNPGWGVTIR